MVQSCKGSLILTVTEQTNIKIHETLTKLECILNKMSTIYSAKSMSNSIKLVYNLRNVITVNRIYNLHNFNDCLMYHDEYKHNFKLFRQATL